MSEKQIKYRNLIDRVKASYPPHDTDDDVKELRLCWCEDCEEINLWTYWQGRGNLDAKIMLVGQDWGCPWDESAKDTMKQIARCNQGHEYDYLNNNPSITDNRLTQLFQAIGFDITKKCPDLFFTNFILGYRNKGISGGYRKEWAKQDEVYFKELADIIEPKVILCLGRSTFEGVCAALDTKLPAPILDYNTFIESANNPLPVTLPSGAVTHVFALAHCGAMGTLNRNRKKNSSLDTQIEDWKKIIPYIHSPMPKMYSVVTWYTTVQ